MRLKKTDYKKVLLMFMAFAIIVLSAGVGSTIAKYTLRRDEAVEAARLDAFHISSDLASAPDENGNPVSSVSWYSGIYENGVRVRLYNYEKDNVALISETDITYSISVTAAAEGCTDTYSVSVQDTDGGSVTASDGEYVLPAIIVDEVAENNYQDIIILCNSDGDGIPTSDFTVTVTTSKPYVTTLSVMVKLVTDSEQPDYTVTDYGWYDVVTIHTNHYEGDLKIAWDSANIAPDNTDELMESWVDVNEGVLAVGAFETYELIFVEFAEGDYTVADATFFDAATGITLTPAT